MEFDWFKYLGEHITVGSIYGEVLEDNKMEKLDEIQGYTAHWYGEDGDLTIGGIDEKDMTKEELNSKNQSVTMYTKKQVMDLLAKGDK